jgi:hypothetical protein
MFFIFIFQAVAIFFISIFTDCNGFWGLSAEECRPILSDRLFFAWGHLCKKSRFYKKTALPKIPYNQNFYIKLIAEAAAFLPGSLS